MIAIDENLVVLAFFAGYAIGGLVYRKPPTIVHQVDQKYIDDLNVIIHNSVIEYHADQLGMVLMPKGFEDIRRGKSKRLP